MKTKTKKILIAVLASVFACSLLLFAGCSEDNKLKTPNMLELDDENVIHWSDVESARSYVVSVEDSNGKVTETTTRNTYYSLDELETGNYYVKVKAVGNKRDSKDSDWSSRADFQKSYSTGLLYKLIDNDTAYAIVDKGKAKGEVVIEDYYRNNLPVTTISDRAFRGSTSVEKIVIGANVTAIGEEAFYGCDNLKSVKLPNDLISMGAGVFQGCDLLEEITIPYGVSSVPEYAFAYCHSLQSVTFEVKETESIDGELFLSGTTTIGSSAFVDCRSITELVMPQTLTGIGSSAFSRMSSLKKVTLNSDIDYINSSAFYSDVSLEEIIFGEDSKLTFIGAGAFQGCTELEEVEIPSRVTKIAARAFCACKKLKTVSLPESLQDLGERAFEQTAVSEEQDGKNFVFVDGWLVEYTGNEDAITGTFDQSILKQSNYYPEGGIVGISEYCMSGTQIGAVNLPASVKYLSAGVFQNCAKLASFTVESGSRLKVIGSACFAHCGLSKVLLPEGLETIEDQAFYDCELLQVMGDAFSGVEAIPSTVTKVGYKAFNKTGLWENAGSYENDGIVRLSNWIVDYNPYIDGDEQSEREISKIDFGEKTTALANYAFYNLTSLNKLENTEKLTNIGAGAFYGCEELTQFTLSNKLKEIKSYTFGACKSLRNVGFENSLNSKLETIGSYAFYDCESLLEIDLENTRVSVIGANAFAFCYSLSSVNLFAKTDYESSSDKYDGELTLEVIGSSAFYNAKKLKELEIPDSVKAIYPYAFFECDSLKTVDLGKGVKYVYGAAFYGCENLEEIDLPSSLVYLGSHAFYKCYSLFEVNFGTRTEGDEVVGGISYIGDYAFYNDEQITSLVIPETATYIGKYAFKGIQGLGSVTLGGNLEYVGAHAFYGAETLTVYVESEKAPDGWSLKWNSYMRPVVYGVELDSSNEYVHSFTVKDSSFVYVNDIRSIGGPRRDGYTFVGWSYEDGGEVVFTETSMAQAPVGRTLYAVWKTAEWEITRGSDGLISSIIVGASAKDIPEELVIDEEEIKSSMGKKLCAWTFVRNGEPVFVYSFNLTKDTLGKLSPGTKLYAVYLDTAEALEATLRIQERRGLLNDTLDIWA